MRQVKLEDVVKRFVFLPPRPNGRGFFSVLCKVCNDHGRKGPRAGFTFGSNGECGYHCFNCGHKASFDPNKHNSMPPNMATVLQAFGMKPIDWQSVVLSSFLNRSEKPTAEEVGVIIKEPKEIQFPQYFYKLSDEDQNDDIAMYAIEYLEARKIDWKNYSFFLARKDPSPDNKRWYGRLIIPIYKSNKLVFWQGRDLSDTLSPKYLNPYEVDRGDILFGYDKLNNGTDEPLYVTEGWFDAFLLDGVCVFGRELSEQQIELLDRSPRQKVVVPDRFGDGADLAKQALRLGWSVALPDIGTECKDVNDAVQKYGIMYTKMSIRERTYEGFMAESLLPLYCVG